MLVESLTQAKNQLSRLIERVRRGERVRILVHGVPAADLVPVQNAAGGESGDDPLGLSVLEREGIVASGTGVIDPVLLEPGPMPGGTALSALLEEERDSR